MKTKRGLPDMTWIPEKKLWRKRGTYKGHKYEKTGLSPEIVLEKAVRGTREELFTLLCLYTGLRREEALGLLWSRS